MNSKWNHRWNRRGKRMAAGGLAILMACSGAGGGISAYSAPAEMEVDETMYVNLDFYGAATKVNVVKSCNFNGRTEFTDYGDYLKVTNMTNDIVPVLEDGLVKWNLPQTQRERFYYQCTLDTAQVELPWKFDVSYKLNGVPTDADQLAGASGLVEINIKAEPNPKAKAYDRDNMILMAAVPVDRSKCYSVEAQGSQTQNLGGSTGVIFSALPGEEGDFTLRIGTDQFEMNGIILSMAPGTMDDMKHIKDVKEAKDTWREAGDQLYSSMEQMALAVEEMREGIGQVQSGMDKAEHVRQRWSSDREGILEGNDQALSALTALSEQMDRMVPYLQTAKDSSEVVYKSMNDIVNTLGEMREPLEKLYNRLRKIQSSSGYISDSLPELQEAMGELLRLNAQLQQNEDLFMLHLASAKGSGLSANRLYYNQEPDEEESDEDEPEEDSSLPVASRSLGTVASSVEKREWLLLGAGSAEDVIRGLTEKGNALAEIARQSKELTDVMSNLMGDVSDTAKYSSYLADNLDFLIEDVTALHDSLNVYYPELQSCLEDAKELVNCTTDALNSGISTSTVIQNTLKDTGGDFDAAARDSLKGSMGLLDKSLNILDSTASLRHAGRTMKDTMDSRLDRFDTENRFLFLDPDAEKVSLTSDKNQSPKTIQIVMRTQEISVEDSQVKTADAEAAKVQVSPFQRMWNVLIEIWRSIVTIFKNR